MDRRFLTVLGVSLLFALVISTVFYQMTAHGSSGGVKRSDSDMRDVVVAVKPLGVGATIKATDIKLTKLPANGFPKGAFSKPEEVIDRPVTAAILMDEPVLEPRLAARGSGVGLAPIIPVGMRGVSVRVNDVSGVTGFVLPGMRVDVLVTGRPPAMTDVVTATCLQNMLVLSAGTTMQADAKGQAIQAPTVTLLATPDQAETLTLANIEGHVQLILRNGSDQTIENTRGREVSELYGLHGQRHKADAPLPPRRIRQVANLAPPPPPPPPPPPDQVVVIRGTTKSIEVIGMHSPDSGR